MKFIFSNFVYFISKFKTSAILNVLGLSVAFAVFTVIAIQTYNDYTFNKGFKKIDTIEYLTLVYNSGEETTYLNYPLAERIDSVIPEVRSFAVIGDWGMMAFHKGGNDRFVYEIPAIFTSRGFLDIFTPEIVMGNTDKLFEDPKGVMISEETAKKMFGDENPIGKNIYDHYDAEKAYTVFAVYKDFPKNSTFENGIYGKVTYIDASEWSYGLFFDIVPGTRETIIEKMNKGDAWTEGELKWMEEDPSNKRTVYLSPLKDIFMDTPGNKASFLSLMAIGIIILIIGYINFLNFSVAMAPSRVKTVNIHKILGINRFFLNFSIQMEGVFLAFIAYMLALLYVFAFSTSGLSSYFSADLFLSANLWMLLIIGVFFLLCINFISIYPARYLTSFKEAIVLNGSFALSPAGVKLRNVLIVTQFTAAIFLICVATFIKMQHDYMQKFNWGIEKENIVYLPVNGLKTDFKTFGEEAIKSPSVLDFTASRFIPGKVYMGWGRNFEGIYVNVKVWPVYHNFLDFFGARITAGDNFTVSKGDSTVMDQMIMNEKFLEKYNFDYNIIGKAFSSSIPNTIAGIAGNVNFESVRNPIEPMAFAKFHDNRQIDYIFFKITGGDIKNAVNSISDTWGKFSDDDAKIKFLDEEINKLYVNEENMARLISLFGFITIIIAIMGIYGLIIFNTRYKVKEIAVRKVNGATENEIVVMLNRSLLILLFISFVIAIPFAYYTIYKWLENFAYKASIPWWLFPGAGLLVLIISVITISWQSWKAATANPVDSLKNE